MIDWQFLFLAWELKGKYPAILDLPVARELFDDAGLLDEMIADRWLEARGRYGSGPRTPTATTSCSVPGQPPCASPCSASRPARGPAAPTRRWRTTSRPPGTTGGSP